MAVGVAIAAAFALPGCAPAGYDAADYGNAQEAADAGAASPEATSTADPIAQADPDATEPPGADAVTDLPEEQITSKLVGAEVKRMGEVIESEEGMVLYRFDDDGDNPSKSNCNGECAEIWPPALTNDGTPEVDGVDPELVGTVTRADGTKQLTVKGWPVYFYIGDKKAGQWKGQNVGGKWFVIKPDGAKNLTCLPPVSKPVAPPKDDAEGSESGDAGGAGSDYSY